MNDYDPKKQSTFISYLDMNRECFNLNHSLGVCHIIDNIIRLLGHVYHFSLLICNPCSFNLYGWAMSEYLPYERFKWLKNDKFDVMSINEKSPIGYLSEVGLEYPDKLQELHNDYPLAPEKRAVSSDMLLSKCCKKIADKYEIKVGDVKN